MAKCVKKKEKYDDWEVDSDVDAIIRVNELLNDETKMPKIRKKFAEKQEAMDDAAKQLSVESKAKKNLKKIFGKNNNAKKENKKDS